MNKIKLSEKILYYLAKRILKKYHPDVVGIVGGVGKTASKQAIYSVLSTKFKVRKNDELNDYGLSVLSSIFNVDIKNTFTSKRKAFSVGIKLLLKTDLRYPDILLLEITSKEPGDLQLLTKYISFRIGIITSPQSGPQSAVKLTKALHDEQQIFIEHLENGGVAVLNYDYEVLNLLSIKSKMVSIGIEKDADITASDPAISFGSDDFLDIKGISFKLNYKGSVVPILIPDVLGVHQIYSVLIAVACGLIYQINLSDISNSLKKYRAPAGRMRVLKGIKNTLLIDDTYSSSPASCKAALRVFSLIPHKDAGEYYAVLGDMDNLGRYTEDAHREVGHYVGEMGIDKLITVGEKSQEIAHAAREAGMPEDKVFSFTNTNEAKSFIQGRLEKNDIILVKGSEIMKMEAVTKELMAEPLRARQLLVTRKRQV